jgi:sialidase-1
MGKCLKSIACFFIGLIIFFTGHAQEKTTSVFVAGTSGFRSYRIPAIVRLKNGELLAFAEGRVNGTADFGNVKIVMKHSDDDGKTWSGLKVVASNDSLQAGNAAPVVDLTDPRYPKGRIFLFYNTGNLPESLIRQGKGKREVWYKTSADNGKTWSLPVNITTQVKRSLWRSYANTPGHALQLQDGKYEGRIYVAANHSAAGPLPHFEDYHAHGYYTDDHGRTFHLSENVSFPGGNEASAAALPDNGVMMNIRNQKGEPRCRIIAISHDGGENWDTVYYDHQLPDPVCEGSLLNIGILHHKEILAFCNNDDTLKRNNLTLYISFNNGKTWKDKFHIASANKDFKGDFTGYSDIVKTGHHTIGILYESDNYKKILFTQEKWDQ